MKNIFKIDPVKHMVEEVESFIDKYNRSTEIADMTHKGEIRRLFLIGNEKAGDFPGYIISYREYQRSTIPYIKFHVLACHDEAYKERTKNDQSRNLLLGRTYDGFSLERFNTLEGFPNPEAIFFLETRRSAQDYNWCGIHSYQTIQCGDNKPIRIDIPDAVRLVSKLSFL